MSEFDHVVVASGARCAATAAFALPKARLLVGRGIDGADQRILEDIDPLWIHDRYTEVVIMSGDHIFAPVVQVLRSEGLTVGVVAVRNHAARELVARASWSRLMRYPSWCTSVSHIGNLAQHDGPLALNEEAS